MGLLQIEWVNYCTKHQSTIYLYGYSDLRSFRLFRVIFC